MRGRQREAACWWRQHDRFQRSNSGWCLTFLFLFGLRFFTVAKQNEFYNACVSHATRLCATKRSTEEVYLSRHPMCPEHCRN